MIVASTITEVYLRPSELKMGHVILTMPLLWVSCHV